MVQHTSDNPVVSGMGLTVTAKDIMVGSLDGKSECISGQQAYGTEKQRIVGISG